LGAEFFAINFEHGPTSELPLRDLFEFSKMGYLSIH
jgi:hypothetical protein